MDFLIRFREDFGNLIKNSSRASSNIAGVGRSSKKTEKEMAGLYKQTRKINHAFTNLSKDANRSRMSIMGFGKAVNGLNMAFGIAKIMLLARVIGGSIQASMEAIETANLFSVALGEVSESADRALLKISQVTGLDHTNMRNAVATYALLARSMGMSSEQADVLSNSTYRLALDLSSLTNVPINQVLGDLRSGLLGQSETVYKYGIDVTEASLKTEALAQGISKSVRNMSQGEKMALRYSVMLKQTSLAHGDFARTIETPANQLRILRERITTLSRSIGNIFIPVLAKTLPYLNAMVQLLTELADRIAIFIGFDPSDNNVKDVGASFSDTEEDIDNATKSAKKFKNSLLGIDEINLLPSQSDSGGLGTGGSGGNILSDMEIPKMTDFLDGIKLKSDEILDGFKTSLKTFVDDLKLAFDSINTDSLVGLVSILTGLSVVVGLFSLKTMLPAMITLFTGLSTTLSGLALNPVVAVFLKPLISTATILIGIFTKVAGAITALTIPAFAIITTVIALTIGAVTYLAITSEEFRNNWIDIWESIKRVVSVSYEGFLKPLLTALKDLFLQIWNDGLKPFFLAWVEIIGSLSKILSPIIKVILDLFAFLIVSLSMNFVPKLQLVISTVGTVFSVLIGVVTSIVKIVVSVLGGIATAVAGVVNIIRGIATGDWKRAWDGFVNVVIGVFDVIFGIAFGIVNLILDVINSVIKAINGVKIPLPTWVKELFNLKDLSFNIKTIPNISLPNRDRKSADGGVGSGSSKGNVHMYARGGYLNAGDLFVAGEAGSELIGKFGNKQTVMPLENTDFVQAMYEAVFSAVSQSMGNNSGSKQDIILQVDKTELGRVAIGGINNITRQTGKIQLVL